MYDAVHLFAKALDDLDRSRHIDITPLQCDGDLTWQHGNSVLNYMKLVGQENETINPHYPNTKSTTYYPKQPFSTTIKKVSFLIFLNQ